MHHLTGAEALAYARIRKASRRERLHPGRPPAGGPRRPAHERDVGRQPVLAAADLLDAVGHTIRTDVPTDAPARARGDRRRGRQRRRGPASSSATRWSHPLNTRYGDRRRSRTSTAIQAVAARALLGAGHRARSRWPTPKADARPRRRARARVGRRAPSVARRRPASNRVEERREVRVEPRGQRGMVAG